MDLNLVEQLAQPNWTAKFLLDFVSVPLLTLSTPPPPKHWSIEELIALYFPVLNDIITSEVRLRGRISFVIIQCGGGMMIEFELRGPVLDITPHGFPAMLVEIIAGGVIRDVDNHVCGRRIPDLRHLQFGHCRFGSRQSPPYLDQPLDWTHIDK